MYDIHHKPHGPDTDTDVGKIILNYSWEKIVNEHQTISFFFKQHKSEKPQTILFFPSRSSVDNVLALENNKIILQNYEDVRS